MENREDQVDQVPTGGRDVEPDRVYDVIVVGLGPVGQVLALDLARRGHSVVVVEKREQPYPLPRAVHYDPDISRYLDALGVSGEMVQWASPTPVYEWQDARRRTLLRFEFAAEGDQGWPESTMFYQPALERALMRHGARQPNILVLRGTEVVDVEQREDHVDVGVRSDAGRWRLRARHVVGCDGANSTVREHLPGDTVDLGYFYDWLVLDLVPHEERMHEPDNLQVCDPARPVTHVNSGPGRRRFEFMRMPGEDVEQLASEESAWGLLAPWGMTPETAAIERRTIYTFQARWSPTWRHGRLMLAGDAAHLMPPFFGQGLVSGIRDAANLAWKLDLVLAGRASDDLLDTYSTERSAHVQHAIGMSVELGKVICATDPEVVAARDAHLLAAGPVPEDALPPVPPERLGAGVFPAGEPASTPGAGVLSVQGRVGWEGVDGGRRCDLLDRLVGRAFALVCDASAVDEAEARALVARAAGLDLVVVRVQPGAGMDRTGLKGVSGSDVLTPGDVVSVSDEDDRYLSHLAAVGAVGFVVRPDFYVYGAADAPGLAGLMDSLGAAVRLVDA